MDLRSPDEIRARLDTLREQTPERDDESRIPDREQLARDAKVTILHWALEERDPVAVYDKYHEYRNTGTTCDLNGDRTRVRMDAKMEALEWVMQVDDPQDVDDPERFFDRLNDVTEALFNLHHDARVAAREDSEDLERVKDDVPVDAEYVASRLDSAWHVAGDARTHMLNDDDPVEGSVTLADTRDLRDIDDASFMAAVRAIQYSNHFSINTNHDETMERIQALDEEYEFLSPRARSELLGE